MSEQPSRPVMLSVCLPLDTCATGHPLDTVKTRLVTHSGRYNGMVDCFRKTLMEEGLQGLYAGAASPLLGAMAMNGMVFFSYGFSKMVSVPPPPKATPARAYVLYLEPILG